MDDANPWSAPESPTASSGSSLDGDSSDPAWDRPECLPIPGTLSRLKTIACAGGLAYLLLQSEIPAIAPPVRFGEPLLWLIGALAAWGATDHRLRLSRSGTYRLLGTPIAAAEQRVLWWQSCFVYAGLPGSLWLLLRRSGELANGAIPAVDGAATAGGFVVFFLVFLPLTLLQRQPMFLHPLGIQINRAHLLRWHRIVCIHHHGPYLMPDIDRPRSHPVSLLVLDNPEARAAVLDEARRRGIPIHDRLPGMWTGKIAGVLFCVALTVAAGFASRGMPALPMFYLIGAGILATLACMYASGFFALEVNVLLTRPTRRLDSSAFTARWMTAWRAATPGGAIEELGPLHLRSRPNLQADWSEHRLDQAWSDYRRDPRCLDALLDAALVDAATTRSI